MAKALREAACVIVFNHLEQVLFVKRPKTVKAWADMLVFPGGKVDKTDAVSIASHAYPHIAPRFFHSAVRELFEEVDIALTTPALHKKINQETRRQWRNDIAAKKASFDQLLQETNATPLYESLVPYKQLITPVGLPHRFDTWFFLAQIDAETMEQAETLPFGTELDELHWLSPTDALKGYVEGVFNLATPQLYLLNDLKRFQDTPALWTHAKKKAQTIAEPLLAQRLPVGDDGIITSVFNGDPLHQVEGKTNPLGALNRVILHPNRAQTTVFVSTDKE
ncbi:hypothetical protein THRCLA_05370 [Thraustotheca clavata]|uniref:Nudix hydrolase domain-containing protein n=1 Tax=Thraustotheca clavata TaxID=74557 RepID=A0A1V9ZW37_9STRA|nr:hypothetical protein THRCLA_05370 [Thraustotheca clavata]